MVAAVLVELERHDRDPGAGKGALSYATQLLSTSQPIRAPRWRWPATSNRQVGAAWAGPERALATKAAGMMRDVLMAPPLHTRETDREHAKSWLSRPLRGSCCEQNPLTKQVEAGTTVHLPLNQLEPGDLA